MKEFRTMFMSIYLHLKESDIEELKRQAKIFDIYIEDNGKIYRVNEDGDLYEMDD